MKQYAMKNMFPALLFMVWTGTAVTAQPDIRGSWITSFSNDEMSAEFRWTLTGDTFTLDMGKDGRVEVSGEWKMDGDRLIVRDKGGPMACPENQPGTYTFIMKDNTLKLTPVEDNCPGRKMINSKVLWKRE